MFVCCRLRNALQMASLLLLSPISCLVAIGAANHLMTQPPSTRYDVITADPLLLLKDAWQGAQSALLYSVVDAHMYGVWTFTLGTFSYWPLWLLFWALLWTDPLSS